MLQITQQQQQEHAQQKLERQRTQSKL